MPEEILVEYYNIGNAYFDVGNYDKAIEYYNRALVEGNSMENRIRYNLGISYSQSNRTKLALEQFDILLTRDPENFKVLQSKAYAYYLAGEDQEAITLYDQILETFEFDSTALYNKALIIKGDNPEDAIALLERLYEVEPESEVALILGELYLEAEERELFVELYEGALSQDSRNPGLLAGLIDYYLEESLFFRSIEYINQILEIDDFDDRAQMLFLKARTELLDLDDYSSGFNSLVEALDEGFDDEGQLKELLENEKLSNDSQLRDYMQLRGFL